MPPPPPAQAPPTQIICAVPAARPPSTGGAPDRSEQEAGREWGVSGEPRSAARGCQVPGAFTPRPAQQPAAHQGPTEGEGQGGPQHKGQWIILHPVNNQTDPSWGSLAPKDAHAARSHLKGQQTLVPLSHGHPGSGREDPEATRG